MSIPFFTPGDDPGPDFSELLRRVGLAADRAGRRPWPRAPVTHGTTVVAIRYADGVVMAGDRRATSGNFISHRSIEKVFPADRWSGVAIAGAAGPAMEMVKLFQLQLEHYEKVEGSASASRARPTSSRRWSAANLPAAMQGLAVVPLFAGYDLRRRAGPAVPVRRHRRPLRGERLRRHPAPAASTPARSSSSASATRSAATTPSTSRCRRSVTAADEDSATGGPDLVRGIFPVVATITADGLRARRRRPSSPPRPERIVGADRAPTAPRRPSP